MKLLFSLFFLLFSLSAYATQPTSWKTALKNGEGSITIYWFDSEPFIYHDKNGTLTGLEFEIIEGFVDYLKQTKGIHLNVNWVRADSFNEAFNSIANENSSGTLSSSAYSITDKRKQVVSFSAAYLSDIAVIISSKNVPVFTNEQGFKKVFSELSAITIKGTSYEHDLNILKESLDMDFDIEYIPSSGNMYDAIALNDNVFGYIDLSAYLTNLKKKPDLHVMRQSLFPVKQGGYGFIFPTNTDWLVPFNQYLNSAYFNRISLIIINKHLQRDIYELIKLISSGKQVNADEEILLLTKEKEIQHQELLEKALANQKNKVIINAIVAAFILAVIGLIILYKVYVAKVQSNTELQEQKLKIEQQQENIEHQNKAIESRNNELIALNEEKNNLINVLAHDLRTPINQISGLVQLHTLQHKNLSSEDKFTFDTIMDSVSGLNNMISKILDVEAIESNASNIKLEPVDASKLAEEVVAAFKECTTKKSIQIEQRLGSKIMVNVDRMYLQQIYNNLISNALKFSYPGTEVNFSITEVNEQVVIKIADQGPGFTKQDMGKMFGKFQRLSAKPTAGETSTGLGLSIVKKYIDLLNGTIECDSGIGKGTVFTIYLPALKK